MDLSEIWMYLVDMIDYFSHQFLGSLYSLFQQYGYLGLLALLIGGIILVLFFL